MAFQEFSGESKKLKEIAEDSQIKKMISDISKMDSFLDKIDDLVVNPLEELSEEVLIEDFEELKSQLKSNSGSLYRCNECWYEITLNRKQRRAYKRAPKQWTCTKCNSRGSFERMGD